MTEKGLPESSSAEFMVLGSVVLGYLLYENAGVALSVEDFSTEKNRRIFARMGDIHKRGEKIDRITLVDELRKQGQLEGDSISYVTSLGSGLPELINIDSYIRLIKEKATLRKLAFQGQRIQSRAIEATDQAAAIIAESAQELREIEAGLPLADEVPGLSGIIDDITPTEILHPTTKKSLRTGLSKIDYATAGGLELGTLTIIGGRPGTGKTVTGLTIAKNFAESGVGSAFFSMEMSARNLIERMMCSMARVEMQKFRLGTTNEHEKAALQRALSSVYELPIYIDEIPGSMQTVSDIARKVDRLKREKNIHAVFIDYVQLMTAGARGKGRDNRREDEVIAYVIEGLRAIAKRMNVAMCVLAQLNRGSETRADHRPSMAELRGSGALEQCADVVMLIYREFDHQKDRADLEELTELVICKQRSGPTGSIPL